MTATTRRDAAAAAAAGCALVTILATSCGGREQPARATAPDGVRLVLDGGAIEVRDADVEPFEHYFDELDPTMGRNYRRRELLDQHLLPLLLARRAFGKARAEQRAQADALRAVADNSIELQRKGSLAGGEERSVTRNEVPIPVAMWAFRPENLGAVSEPIETAEGFVLVAPLELEPGLTPVVDRLTAFFVEFHAQDGETYDAWIAAERQRLAGRVDFADPGYRDALPLWLRP